MVVLLKVFYCVQIYHIMAGLSPDNRARVIVWEKGCKKKPTGSVDDIREAKMFDKLPAGYKLEDRVIRAIRVHLHVRSFDHKHIHSRRSIVQIPLATVAALPFEVFSAWRSNTDDGDHLYRTEQTRRRSTKDASRFSVSGSNVFACRPHC
jgi:hypothetical protein